MGRTPVHGQAAHHAITRAAAYARLAQDLKGCNSIDVSCRLRDGSPHPQELRTDRFILEDIQMVVQAANGFARRKRCARC